MKIALNGLRIWGWQFVDPPEIQPAPKLEAFSSAFSASGDYTVSIEISTPVYIARLQVFGARHFSTVTPRFVKTWREIAVIQTAGGGADSANIRADWLAIFGEMKAGEAYSVKAILFNSCIELLPPPPTSITGVVVSP